MTLGQVFLDVLNCYCAVGKNKQTNKQVFNEVKTSRVCYRESLTKFKVF